MVPKITLARSARVLTSCAFRTSYRCKHHSSSRNGNSEGHLNSSSQSSLFTSIVGVTHPVVVCQQLHTNENEPLKKPRVNPFLIKSKNKQAASPFAMSYQKKKYPNLAKIRTEWSFIVEGPQAGMTLSEFLIKRIKWMNRRTLEDLILENRITMPDYEFVVPDEKLSQLQKIYMTIPAPPLTESKIDTAFPEKIPITVLMDDGVLFAINKQANLAVQPRFENHMKNVLAALHARYRHEDPELDKVPHLAHRLDMDTSGVLLLLWDRKLTSRVQRQFESRAVHKEYLAIVYGCPSEDQGTVDVPIISDPNAPANQLRYYPGSSGKEARTDWVVEEKFANFSLVRFKPHHGRTHQIRLHALYMGHPMLCDHMHGGGDSITKAQLLAAEVTAVELPIIKTKSNHPHELVTSIDLSQLSPPLAAARTKKEQVSTGPNSTTTATTTSPTLTTETDSNPASNTHATSTKTITTTDTTPSPSTTATVMSGEGDEVVLDRCALHSNVLELKHPSTAELVRLEAPLPSDMLRVLEILRRFQL
eukprot:m.117153 g.117153  ORF g.117153 m.117153 type:complete len:533 (+) comp28559_c0_seq1:146-1744(+)